MIRYLDGLPKTYSEKWNLTAKFNCLQAIYFYAPSALAVPMSMTMCGVDRRRAAAGLLLRWHANASVQSHQLKQMLVVH